MANGWACAWARFIAPHGVAPPTLQAEHPIRNKYPPSWNTIGNPFPIRFGPMVPFLCTYYANTSKEHFYGSEPWYPPISSFLFYSSYHATMPHHLFTPSAPFHSSVRRLGLPSSLRLRGRRASPHPRAPDPATISAPGPT